MVYLPLEGVRVVDFTWAAVGPYCTQLLAVLGAQVIKVGSARQVGGVPPGRGEELHRQLNHSKLSVALNLGEPRGVDIARRLIAISDVVTENFRPGTLDKFNLHYGELVKLRPDLVMVSASILGQSGRHAQYAAFAPIFAAASGLSAITGLNNGLPTELGISVDCTIGLFMAQATLAAVYHRSVSGHGQFVDVSGRDAMACVIGDVLMEASTNGRDRPLVGNLDDVWAPHGVYPCQEPDTWLSIAITCDSEWKELCVVMGRPELMSDPRYTDRYQRRQNREALDSQISAWTRLHTPDQLTSILQMTGIASFPSFSAKDLFEDPHLQERQFFHVSQGGDTAPPYTIIAPPWLSDGERPPVRRDAPTLGEDNDEILSELLGIGSVEMDTLRAEGVLQ